MKKSVRVALSAAAVAAVVLGRAAYGALTLPAYSGSRFADVWGKVESGMEYIDQIKKGDQARNGAVTNPDRIIKMQVAADADKAGDKAK